MSNTVTRYTPTAVEDNDTFIRLYSIEQAEIDKLHATIKKVVDNSYIDTADESRLSEWEAALGLPNGYSKPLSVRVQDIKDYLAFLPPITRYKLEDILTLKYGAGHYYLNIKREIYEVIIGVETAPDDFVEFMYDWFKIKNKQYEWLESYTYTQLGRYRGNQNQASSIISEQSFQKLLRKIIPANMLLTFGIMYMYSYLRGRYVYMELEEHDYAYWGQYSTYS